MGCEATSLFFEIKQHETDLPPLSYRRRMHAAGQYTLYRLLGREDQVRREFRAEVFCDAKDTSSHVLATICGSACTIGRGVFVHFLFS